MGMDSWVFSCPKGDFEEHETLLGKLEELKKEMNRKIEEKCLKLREKYPDFKDGNVTPEYVAKNFADGDAKEFVAYCDRVFASPEQDDLEKRINETNGGKSELHYWRKSYPLHAYVTRNFLKDGRDDNCEPIVLTKGGVEKMIETFRDELGKWKESGNSREVEFFKPSECDYVSMENLEKTIQFFENLLGEFSEDVVIYYYAWY